MPYKDKKKKVAYQKRTATPYMQEWREKNREHHRKYIREWARKRRKNKEKRVADLKKMKSTVSYLLGVKTSKYRSRVIAAKMTDGYIVKILVRHNPVLTTSAVRQYPELIEHHRKLLLTKRVLKNDNHSNKQR